MTYFERDAELATRKEGDSKKRENENEGSGDDRPAGAQSLI